MKFDLHCHSTFSDGELTPNELFKLASDHQITHLALTDHDSVSGLAQAEIAAAAHAVKLIPGLELSATWRGQLLHVVGLGVDPENPALLAGVQKNQQARFQRADAIIADFQRAGIDLEAQARQVIGDAIPTRPHFAQALINLGYAKNKQQAFRRYLVRGKPGFVPLVWPTIEEVGDWITQAGGVAVLAHPMRYHFTRTKLLTLISEMKPAGITAIEVSTPVNDVQQINQLADIAVQQELYGSMGSDFHALNQPWARLGSALPLPERVTPVWQQLSYAA